MSKERLEEARLMAEMLRVETRLPHDFPFDLVDWLVKYAREQAERVQELEEEIRRIRRTKYRHAYEQGKFDTNMKVWYEMPELEYQNKRYREALEFYAGGKHVAYKLDETDDDLVVDYGETARKALEESK